MDLGIYVIIYLASLRKTRSIVARCRRSLILCQGARIQVNLQFYDVLILVDNYFGPFALENENK